MADDLERKALREELYNNGFNIVKIVSNSQLPALLTNVLIELAEGKYQEIRIIPSDRIVENDEWRLEQPSQAVYVKDNPEWIRTAISDSLCKRQSRMQTKRRRYYNSWQK